MKPRLFVKAGFGGDSHTGLNRCKPACQSDRMFKNFFNELFQKNRIKYNDDKKEMFSIIWNGKSFLWRDPLFFCIRTDDRVYHKGVFE
ncbi:MAG: hypothetical protein C6W57_16395 [Caldibacillus debilis]|jgi:hypothetical protein|nr:MAG: hypothetical protein BAA00_21760 [Parageobacillus thermoglucosidasius]REJ13476.1 MAG: hypothetical protein C6W57_16395 [Caldibacillus debilis]REJ23377.1 MAG: hypothetical protein C6W56_15265 [Caldibacillus debilis]